MTRLLYTLSLPLDGGGDGSAPFIGVSRSSTSGLARDFAFDLVCGCDCDCDLDVGLGIVFDTGVGLDIMLSGSRAGRFASRGESGDGELRSGEEDSGDETCGV